MHLHTIVARVGTRIIRWVFAYQHDCDFHRKHIFPWALPQAELLPDDHPHHDFTVCVAFDNDNLKRVAELSGFKFFLTGECYVRYPRMHDSAVFVQNFNWRDWFTGVHYAPMMLFWCPPVSVPKRRCCSVVESGKYRWRTAIVGEVQKKLELDIYGKLSGRTFDGYHEHEHNVSVDNEKYLGIREHAFYLSLENRCVPDYITEKMHDAIMCEAVPIYRGAPNVELYYVPDSYIQFKDVDRVNWMKWQQEYERRRPAVLRQKELLRTRFNIFSYFALLTADLSLLDRKRPITLE